MANCRCEICGRPIDCGEDVCIICECLVDQVKKHDIEGVQIALKLNNEDG